MYKKGIIYKIDLLYNLTLYIVCENELHYNLRLTLYIN